MERQNEKKDRRAAGNAENSGKRSKKKRKKWQVALIVVLVILLLAAAVLGAAYALIKNYYNKSNYVKDEDIVIAESVETDSIGLTQEEASALEAQVSQTVQEIELPNNQDVYNILLIGVDRRDKTWYGNSDSMILMSINKQTKQIHMTSFMRDLYADIPGKGVHKLNAACAYGGGPLLVQTIEENYRVSIDNYASVDFSAMIDIVDVMGGIEIEVSDAEVAAANESIVEMCNLEGISASQHLLTSSGNQLMDGYQAVAYARIRKVGNSDYERTERQREVLEKIMQKASSLSIGELNTVANAILPEVTHNVDEGTMLSLLTDAPAVLGYQITQSRIPYDGLYTSRGEMLVPDFEATIQQLQTEIYGSSTVEGTPSAVGGQTSPDSSTLTATEVQ